MLFATNLQILNLKIYLCMEEKTNCVNGIV
jgi:hypothetical protein